eukprot:5170293-Amphidinium_carterae.1
MSKNEEYRQLRTTSTKIVAVIRHSGAGAGGRASVVDRVVHSLLELYACGNHRAGCLPRCALSLETIQ